MHFSHHCLVGDDLVLFICQESLLVSDVSQKGTFHSSSTASNLGTHMRTHGVVDLMVVSFINKCVVHPSLYMVSVSI